MATDRPDPALARPVADVSTAPAEIRVVVVTYSPGAHLERFLDTLPAATHRPVEVVLADNGSTDGVPERVSAAGRGRLLRTGGNLGYGRAANHGAAGAQARWILVANPDITWAPGALDALCDAAARWPRGGAFGPAIRTPEGRLYPSARAIPSLGRGIGHALCGWWWPANPWTAAYRQERGAPREAPVGWLSGSCLLLRRDAFEAVGGFDPAYFMFFEDLDLCERLGRAGWQSVYVPAAVVTHDQGHSWRDRPAPMVRAHHRAAYTYLARRYAGRRWLPLRVALRLGLAARAVAAMLFHRVGEETRPTRSADLLED